MRGNKVKGDVLEAQFTKALVKKMLNKNYSPRIG
jgi:hypothetical protein